VYEATQDAVWKHGIDLAREPDFDLGFLRVRPATCTVEADGIAKVLQRRIMQVLVALAQVRGAVVSQDELIIACWRGLSVSDDAIYRCISKLRKLAAGYPKAPFAIEAIPGVGYRLTASNPEVEPALGRRRLGPVLAAAAALLLVGALVWLARLPGETSTLVTVQQFGTSGTSAESRSLARQFADTMVNEFGEGHIDAVLAEDAGKSRKPGLIVAGQIRDGAGDIIVDVRVEDGATRAALWSASFRRDRRRVAGLPLEVAARVADSVTMANFARTANPPLTDQAGLSALLHTSDMFRDAYGGTWAQMVDNAQGLVARHPDFAFGHSLLASAYGEAADSIAVPAQAEAMRAAARREAELTLKLDPQDAGAYTVLWGIEPPNHYRAQEQILLRGIKVARHPKPALGGLYSYEGTLLSSVGRLREALSYQLIARATDEWGPPKAAKLTLNYANLGDLPAARTWLSRAAQRWPNHSAVQAAQLYVAGFVEPPASGLALIDSVATDDDRKAIWRAFIQAKTHRTAALIGRIGEAADTGIISRDTELLMLAGLGETRLALAAANRALDDRKLDPRTLFAPVLAGVRRDPAFLALATRMGLVDYWRETGKRPDFCTGKAAASDCPADLRAALKR
jgi:hypothetical protein